MCGGDVCGLMSNYFHHLFKMVATAILYFQNVEILGSQKGKLNRVKMHHLAKFYGNRSNRCWDTAIVSFFQYGSRSP